MRKETADLWRWRRTVDYDAVIIGGGPAGLTAGIYLGRAGYRVLLLEKEAFGGQLKNIEWIENYPGFSQGVSGPELTTEMIDQAARYGLNLEIGEGCRGARVSSSCTSVVCADGGGYTCNVVIQPAGRLPKRLGVPGEETFVGHGVIHCVFCDEIPLAHAVVAVCGGGDERQQALYLAKLASKVILIEAEPALTASAVLRQRTRRLRLETRCGEGWSP